jgi:hypothetical protein
MRHSPAISNYPCPQALSGLRIRRSGMHVACRAGKIDPCVDEHLDPTLMAHQTIKVPPNQGKDHDVAIAQEAEVSRLLPIQDADDQWETHRSSAAAVSGSPAPG